MESTNIPASRNVDTVANGSLVRIPHENRWGIKTDHGLFKIDDRRRSNVNGKVADFGIDYEITIDLDGAARVSFPFVGNELPPGTLVVFEENGVQVRAIAIAVDVQGTLQTIDLPSGEVRQRGNGSSEGLAYSSWSMAVRTSDDQHQVIYEYGGHQP